MITVTLYSRSDCHLCEVAKEDLDGLREQYPHELVLIDVDSNADLKRAYGFEVPVVEVGPYTLRAPITRQELQMTLAAATDRHDHLESIQNPALREASQRTQTWTQADGISYWIARHYLGLFNLFILVYVGLPFLAPALLNSGIEAPARLIYRSYSIVCHQLAFRSFFLFGEQAEYPRQAAGVPEMLTYEQATGLSGASDSQDLFMARNFVGNEQIGYKVALCERDVAIYAGILFFGVLYAATGRRFPPLPWYLWILIGLVPIALDGVSQLISQPPFNFIAYRESTPQLRILTGALFGVTTAWFGYPMVEESMRATRQLMAKKFLRVKGNGA